MDNDRGSVFTPARIRRLRDQLKHETELDVYLDELKRVAASDTPDRTLMFGALASVAGAISLYKNVFEWWGLLLLVGGVLAVAGGAGALCSKRSNMKHYEQRVETIQEKLNAEPAEG